MRSPEALYVLLIIWGIYLCVLPQAMYWDAKRKTRFSQEFLYDIDGTFMQEEVGYSFFFVFLRFL